MDRSIIYPVEQTRGYDFVSFEHDVLVGLGDAVNDILGTMTTVVAGVTATPTNPASLAVTLTGGRVYALANADAVTQGDIVADPTNIIQQGMINAQSVTLSTTGLTAGQSRFALIQASFQQSDQVRSYPSADPNGGVMAFYNTANPSQPLNGQNGSGGVLPTARLGQGIISVVYGTAASTGTETPPQPSAGAAPLFLVDLAYGQTQIISSQILPAAPSANNQVPNNYPYAPILAGLLNSHHSGTAGQAPQIKLPSEVQGLLPLANLPTAGVAMMSNVLVFSTTGSGSWTVPSGVTGVIVYITGAGGGSGGCAAGAGGGGGGAGGTAIGRFAVTPGSVIPYVVGAGGTAGATGGGNGGAGGQSSFGTGPLAYANGGAGGIGGTSGNAPGGLGGTASSNSINATGGDGEDGQQSSSVSFGGMGGTSFWGGGGRGASGGGVGGQGRAFGSGAGGSYSTSGVGYAGNAGAPGMVVIWW